MCNLLSQISKIEFKKEVPISFDDINYGFTNYKNLCLTTGSLNPETNCESQFISFFTYLFNNSSNCYVDLFLCNLSLDEKNNLRELLTEEDKKILDFLLFSKEYTSPYFKVNDENIIPFLVRLSTREIFFTTFYFPGITIWGNYNFKFPVFYKEDSSILSLSEICNKLNLVIK